MFRRELWVVILFSAMNKIKVYRSREIICVRYDDCVSPNDVKLQQHQTQYFRCPRIVSSVLIDVTLWQRMLMHIFDPLEAPLADCCSLSFSNETHVIENTREIASSKQRSKE